MPLLTEASLLTVAEAAEIANVHPQTIYALIQQGDLPAVRIGSKLLRVPRAVLEAYLNSQLQEWAIRQLGRELQ